MTIATFTLGFVIGSATASLVVILIMAAVTSGKFTDMQDRHDLERAP